jgi:hypothetical protein
MIMVALLSLMTGMVLGMRFKLLILVPAIACVVLVAAGYGIAFDYGLGLTMLIVAAALITLQVGYFVGVLIRHSVTAARLSALRSASLTDAPVARRVVH